MRRYALLLISGVVPAVSVETPRSPAPLLRPDVQLLASQPLLPSQGVGHVDCEMDFRPLVAALLPPNSSFWFFNPSLAQSPRSAALLAGTVRVDVLPNDGFGCLRATQNASSRSSIPEQMRALQCRQTWSSNDVGTNLVVEFEVANTSPCKPLNASLAGPGEDPRVLRSPNGALVTSSQFWPRYSWNMQRDITASPRTALSPVWYKGQRLARWKGGPDEAPPASHCCSACAGQGSCSSGQIDAKDIEAANGYGTCGAQIAWCQGGLGEERCGAEASSTLSTASACQFIALDVACGACAQPAPPGVLQIYEGPHSSVGDALDDFLDDFTEKWSDDYRTAYTFRRAVTNCDTYRAANFTCRSVAIHANMNPDVICSSASNPLSIPPEVTSVGAAAEAQLLGRGLARLTVAMTSAWPVVQDKNWSPIYLDTKMRNFIFVQQFDPFITCESSVDLSEELACSACHHISTSSSQAAVSKLRSRAEAASRAAAAGAGLPTPTSVESVIHLNGAPVLRIPELDNALVGVVHGITMLRWASDTGNTTGILKDYRHFFFSISDKPPFTVTEISAELPLQRAYSAAPWFGPCDLAERIREHTVWPGALDAADQNYWNAPACSNVSFVSSMEYADADRSELLIGYGDGDSSARVLRIPTAEVMQLFKHG